MARKKYKYDKGVVILENKEEVIITSYQLEDEGIRAKYKNKTIFDTTREVPLYIRSRGKSSHFYSRGISRKNIRKTKYYNENHKEKIEILLRFLKARDRVRICTNCWDFNKMNLETIFSFKDYYFSKEVKQSINESKYFITDIFGVSKSLNKTDKEPHIAIEVIDSHFPNFETFNYLRKLTKDSCLIILFYYLEFEPKINQMMNNKGDSNNGKLRISHYMQDGSFWISDERIEEKDYSYIKSYQTDIDFTDEEEYYKAIKELVLDKLKK